MKKIIVFASLFISLAAASGQSLTDCYYQMNFENQSQLIHLFINPVNNHNNLWQVGRPQKTNFISAHSSPNVIITDTVNPYPVNDTSSFEIHNISQCSGWVQRMTVNISGYYKIDSDSLADYGSFEFSPDKGHTWIDLINNTTYASLITWSSPKPVLTGRSSGWKWFFVDVGGLGMQFSAHYGDTLIYRFTFISDSVQTNKDGLMFDDLNFNDYGEDIKQLQSKNTLSIYPNPGKDEIIINHSDINSIADIDILNASGQVLLSLKDFTGSTIDVRQLPDGLYFLKYRDEKTSISEKIIIQH